MKMLLFRIGERHLRHSSQMLHLAFPQQLPRVGRARLSTQLAYVAYSLSERWTLGEARSSLTRRLRKSCSASAYRPRESPSFGGRPLPVPGDAPISLKRSNQNLQLSTSCRPITLCPRKRKFAGIAGALEIPCSAKMIPCSVGKIPCFSEQGIWPKRPGIIAQSPRIIPC